MKKTLHILLIALTCCEGCKKDDPKPLTELEKLPAATQSGKNTFGCLLNGKAWVSKASTDVNGVYQQGTLVLGGTLYKLFQTIGIVVNENNASLISEGKSYSLLMYPESYSQASIQITNNSICEYLPQKTYEGYVQITKMDRVNYIVSGFFEFSTATSGCDTLKITNGRFDLRYIP